MRRRAEKKSPGGGGNGRVAAFGVTDNGLVLTALHEVGLTFTIETPLGNVELRPSYIPPRTWSYADGDDAEGTYTLIAKDGTRYNAEIVAINRDDDLAILSIAKTAHGKTFPFMEFERVPLRHDSVVAIGSPFGHPFSVADGIISDPARTTADGEIRVQTSAMIHAGNSGGPLILLRNHKVAGVVTSTFNPLGVPFGIGLGFAVPASVAAKFLDDTLRMIKEGRTQGPVAQ